MKLTYCCCCNMDVKGIDTSEAVKTQMPLWLILKMKIYNIKINMKNCKT